jgi:hypothetical protein
VSLVLLAILVAIWASILVPLLRRERATWPGGRRPPVHDDGSTPAGGGGAVVWRLEPPSLDQTAGEAGRTAPLGSRSRTRGARRRRFEPLQVGEAQHRYMTDSLTVIDGGGDDDDLPEEPAGRVVLGPVARWGRVAASAQRNAPDRRRAVVRRRQVLAELAVAAAAAVIPALAAGGRWWALATAAWSLLAAYLLALAVLARRRHAASRPARAGGPSATATTAGPRLAAVPVSPE